MKIEVSLKKLLAMYAYTIFFTLRFKLSLRNDIEDTIPEAARVSIMHSMQSKEWPIDFNISWWDFVSYINAISKIENNLVFGLEFNDEEIREVNDILNFKASDCGLVPAYTYKSIEDMVEILRGE